MASVRDRAVIFRLPDPDWRDLHPPGERYGEGSFSVNVRDPEIATLAQVCSIVVQDYVVALALLRSKGRSGTLDTLVAVSNVHALPTPLPVQRLVDQMPAAHRRIASFSESTCYALTAKKSEAWFTAISETSSDAQDAILALRRAQTKGSRATEGLGQLLGEHRDALALGLEASGLDSRLLPEVPTDPEAVSFLNAVSSRDSTSEASIIRHDFGTFGDWQVSQGLIHDMVHFVDPRDPRRKVTAFYGDKEGIERTTGTDLVYYRQNRPGFVLVQYKRMKRTASARPGEKWCYRPDKQLDKEIVRMQALRVNSSVSNVDEWRISSEPFYIKLVEDSLERPESRRLVRGMYFPLDLFTLVLKSPAVTGPQGGVAIGWHNAEQYLTNSEFLLLLQNGIIGSTADSTSSLEKVIAGIISGNRGALVVRDETSPEVDRRRHA